MRCRGCCKCRNIPHKMLVETRTEPVARSRIAYASGGFGKKKRIENTFLYHNRLRRMIGFEPEIANWGTLSEWKEVIYKITSDSSVQPSGKEMNVAPMNGDKLVVNIIQLGTAMAEHGATVNDSCGFHVHVDGSDFSYWEMQKLARIWAAIEQDVYKYLVAPERRTNTYCQPLIENAAFLQFCSWEPGRALPKIICVHDRLHRHKSSLLKIFKNCKECNRVILKLLLMSVVNKAYSISSFNLGRSIVAGKAFRQVQKDFTTFVQGVYKHRERKYGMDRYRALNFASWFYRGTFEFRLKEGLVDTQEMLSWILFCGWVVEAATILSTKEISELHSLEDLVMFQKYSKLTNFYQPLNNIKIQRNWCSEKISNLLEFRRSDSQFMFPRLVRDWVLKRIKEHS